MSEIALVIPTRGSRDLLGEIFGRLAGQSASGRFELVVSLDRAGSEVVPTGEWPFPVHLVSGDSGAASGARNRGWRAANTPLILFLDDDVLPDPGFVEAHLTAHAQRPGIEHAVLGALRWADGLEITPFMRYVERGLQFDYATVDGEIAQWWHLYTANVSVKRASLELVGGFDEERFPFGYEDLDLAARISEHGLTLRYEPRASAGHAHAMTLDGWLAQVKRIAVSEHAFITAHPEFPPYFHDRFARALRRRVPSGKGERLIGLVPRATPLIGARVWASAEASWERALAESFMQAWDQAAESGGGPPAERSPGGGSVPGGPK